MLECKLHGSNVQEQTFVIMVIVGLGLGLIVWYM